LVRWILRERGWEALGDLLGTGLEQASSRVVGVEVWRAVRRSAVDDRVHERVTRVLEQVTMVELDADIARVASQVAPSSLRSLDAIHVATCLTLIPEIEAVVTYDQRLAEAARAIGLTVVSP
jgi:predicted nucleic acid-binding protein